MPDPAPSTVHGLALAAVRDRGPATLSELARATDFSRPTLQDSLAALEQRGIVEQATERRHGPGGGRPARSYRLAADDGVVLGIDVSRGKTVVIVADRPGRILRIEHGRNAPSHRRPDFDGVLDVVDNALAGLGRGREHIRAAGLGSAGVVDETGVQVTSPLVRGWRGRKIGAELSDLLGAPVVAENDLNLAASAEIALGAMAGVACGVYALTWRNVAARIAINGEVLKGRRHLAGEVGALKEFQTPPAGPDGLLEGIADTATELARLYADPRDPRGAATRDALVAAMTPGIAVLELSVDPDLVVLGGALAGYADLILEPLAAAVREFTDFRLDAPIVPGRLGADAVALGALLRAYTQSPQAIYATDGVPAPTLTGLPSNLPESIATTHLGDSHD